eukprot:scaffold1616_cov100-Skeletonema_dohrnii-CCMP3373.AAC.4
MNEGDNRLLLLAAVSQRAQSEQMGTPPPEEEEASTALISKDSPCIGDDASKNTAASDGRAVALLSPKQHGMLPRAITTNTGLAGPTTFTLNGNEDIMKGLYQVKIPTLYSPQEPRPPMTQNKKRKVSDGTRDAMMLMYGGRLHAPSTTASFSAVPAPPLGMNGGGYHQDSNAVVGGAAASTPMLGHIYHQQIMAMSVAGLSAPNMMSMMQGRPQPQQMMQHQQKVKQQMLIPSDEGPLKKKKKRKKKDATTRRAATTARDVPKYTTTTKDGKPIVFPNQDIYSQMLQMKTLKSSPQEAEALAAQIAPFYSRWRKDEASSSMAAAAPSSSSQWNPSFSVQTTGEQSMHHHQEDPLKIQSRFLEMEMSLTREHQQKQLQKWILEQQNRQRRAKDVSLEQLMAPKLMMQQQHHHHPIDNNHLQLPPMSIPMAQQDPTLLPRNNAHLQVVLRELENQARAEEHDRILQSRRAVELRCHEAVLLEEQMKLREMEIRRERNRLVDLQTVNRLRLQADVLENRLMM